MTNYRRCRCAKDSFLLSSSPTANSTTNARGRHSFDPDLISGKENQFSAWSPLFIYIYIYIYIYIRRKGKAKERCDWWLDYFTKPFESFFGMQKYSMKIILVWEIIMIDRFSCNYKSSSGVLDLAMWQKIEHYWLICSNCIMSCDGLFFWKINGFLWFE